MIDAAFVHRWKAHYGVRYDTYYYDPHIKKGNKVDEQALLKLTEWKNPGRGGKPMPLASNKRKALDRFLSRKDSYLQPGGSDKLRSDFANSAPVYSIFWHHVLFDTPIFDVHTNRAFQWFENKKYQKKREPQFALESIGNSMTDTRVGLARFWPMRVSIDGKFPTDAGNPNW
jgi:hypothetical protein